MWPFDKRIKGVYSPNAQPLKIDFISVITIILSSIIGIWILSYLFGNFLNMSPIGPVMMIILFAVIVILTLIIVKKKKDGAEPSKIDFALVIVLVILLVVGYAFLPGLAPELFQQAVISIKQHGLQAFIK